MKVKEIVTMASELIGVYDSVAVDLEGSANDYGRDTQALLTAVSLVENEIALDYLPLKAEDTVVNDLGIVRFSHLSNAPVRILSVTDEWGNAEKFEIFPDFIRVKRGKVKILYTYAPIEKTLDQQLETASVVSARVFAYGVCKEYCTAVGLYEQAGVWDRKFKDGMMAAMRLGKSRVVASRRWA